MNNKSYLQIGKEVILEDINNVVSLLDNVGRELITENEHINLFSKLSNGIKKNKINSFFQSSIKDENISLLDFFHSLSDDSKIFFGEALNKAINLNDDFQIYVLGCLFESYEANNNSLSYLEKKLYYSINTFSEDDFKIFWGVYKKYEDKKIALLNNPNLNEVDYDRVSRYLKHDYSEILEIKNEEYEFEDIIYLSLNRFADIGILTFVSELQQKDNDMPNPKDHYKINPYAKTLFDCLDKFCVKYNVSCDDLLKLKKSKCDISDWE